MLRLERDLHHQQIILEQRGALSKRIELHIQEQTTEIENRVKWIHSVEGRLTKLLESNP